MKNIFPIIVLFFTLIIPFVNFAQIQVFESDTSNITEYTNALNQDTVFIVYKGENNRSTITLFADFNGIDSLNFAWSKFDTDSSSFVFLEKSDSVKADTIFYGTIPGEDMNSHEGGYRVNIHNLDKGIDTTFTIWVWYQDFFIDGVSVEVSTCSKIELEADTTFQDEFLYQDLSVVFDTILTLKNYVEINWIIDKPNIDTVENRARVSLFAPVEPTTYIAYGIDRFNIKRLRSIHVDETTLDSKGYPILRAIEAEFSAIHGMQTDENIPVSDTDSSINVEAPYGVMFYNESKNSDLFEWVFYNHIDWRIPENMGDTTLLVTSAFEPFDSIYYNHPTKHTSFATSPEGYDIKLSAWGPVYNIDGDRCADTMRKVNFVIVDTTQFPNDYLKLPNVFTPNSNNNNYFHFMQESGEISVKSIKYFSIKIYNRWGNKIYEYEDNDGRWHERGAENPGWDGVTLVGTKAKSGVYYYAIYAQGWDNREFNVGGYVHIFY